MARKLFGLILISAVLAFGAVQTGAFAEGEKTVNDIIEELKLFSKTLGIIEEAYVNDVKARDLYYEAVKGMLAALDKYCEFFGPDKYPLLKIYMKGEYAGIGIILFTRDNYPAVRSVQPGSAAEKAGLFQNDKILKIDGKSMEGQKNEDVSALLRGDADAPVTLTLMRDGLPKEMDITIKREKIELPAVKDATMPAKSIGYFHIVDFQEHTGAQVDEAMKKLSKENLKALIIDLRGNGGGLLPQAVNLAEHFLPEGKKIVSVKSKIKEQQKVYFSSGKKQLPDYPLVVLIDGQSASASEIFSACMQDYHRATIMGVKSYGKASVQSVIPLDDQSAMKITTARYLSPLDRSIDGIGIQPDIVVEKQGDVDTPLLEAVGFLQKTLEKNNQNNK